MADKSVIKTDRRRRYAPEINLSKKKAEKVKEAVNLCNVEKTKPQADHPGPKAAPQVFALTPDFLMQLGVNIADLKDGSKSDKTKNGLSKGSHGDENNDSSSSKIKRSLNRKIRAKQNKLTEQDPPPSPSIQKTKPVKRSSAASRVKNLESKHKSSEAIEKIHHQNLDEINSSKEINQGAPIISQEDVLISSDIQTASFITSSLLLSPNVDTTVYPMGYQKILPFINQSENSDVQGLCNVSNTLDTCVNDQFLLPDPDPTNYSTPKKIGTSIEVFEDMPCAVGSESLAKTLSDVDKNEVSFDISFEIEEEIAGDSDLQMSAESISFNIEDHQIPSDINDFTIDEDHSDIDESALVEHVFDHGLPKLSSTQEDFSEKTSLSAVVNEQYTPHSNSKENIKDHSSIFPDQNCELLTDSLHYLDGSLPSVGKLPSFESLNTKKSVLQNKSFMNDFTQSAINTLLPDDSIALTSRLKNDAECIIEDIPRIIEKANSSNLDFGKPDNRDSSKDNPSQLVEVKVSSGVQQMDVVNCHESVEVKNTQCVDKSTSAQHLKNDTSFNTIAEYLKVFLSTNKTSVSQTENSIVSQCSADIEGMHKTFQGDGIQVESCSNINISEGCASKVLIKTNCEDSIMDTKGDRGMLRSYQGQKKTIKLENDATISDTEQHQCPLETVSKTKENLDKSSDLNERNNLSQSFYHSKIDTTIPYCTHLGLKVNTLNQGKMLRTYSKTKRNVVETKNIISTPLECINSKSFDQSLKDYALSTNHSEDLLINLTDGCEKPADVTEQSHYQLFSNIDDGDLIEPVSERRNVILSPSSLLKYINIDPKSSLLETVISPCLNLLTETSQEEHNVSANIKTESEGVEILHRDHEYSKRKDEIPVDIPYEDTKGEVIDIRMHSLKIGNKNITIDISNEEVIDTGIPSMEITYENIAIDIPSKETIEEVIETGVCSVEISNENITIDIPCKETIEEVNDTGVFSVEISDDIRFDIPYKETIKKVIDTGVRSIEISDDNITIDIPYKGTIEEVIDTGVHSVEISDENIVSDIPSKETIEEVIDTVVSSVEISDDNISIDIPYKGTIEKVIDTGASSLEISNENISIDIPYKGTIEEVIDTGVHSVEISDENIVIDIPSKETIEEVIDTGVSSVEISDDNISIDIPHKGTIEEVIDTGASSLEISNENISIDIPYKETIEKVIDTGVRSIEISDDNIVIDIPNKEIIEKVIDTGVRSVEISNENISIDIPYKEIIEEVIDTGVCSVEISNEKMTENMVIKVIQTPSSLVTTLSEKSVSLFDSGNCPAPNEELPTCKIASEMPADLIDQIKENNGSIQGFENFLEKNDAEYQYAVKNIDVEALSTNIPKKRGRKRKIDITRPDFCIDQIATNKKVKTKLPEKVKSKKRTQKNKDSVQQAGRSPEQIDKASKNALSDDMQGFESFLEKNDAEYQYAVKNIDVEALSTNIPKKRGRKRKIDITRPDFCIDQIATNKKVKTKLPEKVKSKKRTQKNKDSVQQAGSPEQIDKASKNALSDDEKCCDTVQNTLMVENQHISGSGQLSLPSEIDEKTPSLKEFKLRSFGNISKKKGRLTKDDYAQMREEEKMNEKHKDVMIQCAQCSKTMKFKKWDGHNLNKHYYMGWMVGEDPVNLQDQALVMRILTAAVKVKKQLCCALCNDKKSSAYGYMVHTATCQKSQKEIDEVMQTCPFCDRTMLPVQLKTHMLGHSSSPTVGQPGDGTVVSGKRKAAQQAVKVMQNLEENLADYELSQNIGAFYRKPYTKWRGLFKMVTSSERPNPYIACPNVSCEFTTEIGSEMRHHIKHECTAPKIYSCTLCKVTSEDEKHIMEHIKSLHSDALNGIYKVDSEDDNFDDDDEYYDGNHEDEGDNSGTQTRDVVVSPYPRMKFLPNRLTTEVYKSWRTDFENIFYAKELLYLDFACFSHEALKSADVQRFLPEKMTSCNVAHHSHNKYDVKANVADYEWRQYKLFESDIKTDIPTAWCGGPIWCMGWAPGSRSTSYLAVAPDRFMDNKYLSDQCYQHDGLIQIWDFGKLNNKLKKNLPTPKMVLGIAHSFGIIWDMAWCPSGCDDDQFQSSHEKKHARMGLLGVACSDGCAYIFSVPNPSTLPPSETNVYQTDPVVKLQIYSAGSYILEKKHQAVKIFWSQEKDHKIIAVGYSSGMVALYDITCRSRLLWSQQGSTAVFLPYLSFQAYTSSLTGLFIFPRKNMSRDDGDQLVLGLSSSQGCGIWLGEVQITSKKARVSYATHSSHWPQITAFTEDHVTKFNDWIGVVGATFDILARCPPSGELSIGKFGCISGSNGAHYSPWTNLFINVGIAGEVCLYPPSSHVALISTVRQKNRSSKIYLTFNQLVAMSGEPCPINAKNRSSRKIEDYITDANTYDAAAKKFGLLFIDVPMSSKKISEPGYTECSPDRWLLQAGLSCQFSPSKDSCDFLVIGTNAGFLRLYHTSSYAETSQDITTAKMS